jgi:hypothetical protein
MKLALGAAALSACAGCVTPGRAGNLGFRYEVRDQLLGGMGAGGTLAVGAHVDVKVYRPKGAEVLGFLGGLEGDVEGVPVAYAKSSDARVLRALETQDGARVQLSAFAPGAVQVTVVSGERRDVLDVQVAAIERVSVDHWLQPLLFHDRFASDAAFVKGGTGRFFVDLRDAGGGHLVGAGVEPPIASEPPGAAVALPIHDGDLQHAGVRFDRGGAVALLPRNGERVPVQVIDPDEVDALDLVEVQVPQSLRMELDGSFPGVMRQHVTLKGKQGPLAPPAGWRAQDLYAVAARGARKDGAAVVLLGDVARVESRSPWTCAPAPEDARAWVHTMLGDGVTLVGTVLPGACELEVTLGERRARVTVEVAPRPAAPATD